MAYITRLYKEIGLVLCLLPATYLFGQEYILQKYDASNGLAHMRCSSVQQDGMGYLWIGTDDGICRYDGKEFKYYSINENQRYFAGNLSKCIRDTVYITLESGVAICCGEYFKYVSCGNNKRMRFIDCLPLGNNRFVLAGLATGLSLFSKDTLRDIVLATFKESFKGLCIEKDQAGNIWLGTDKGLIFFSKGNLAQPTLVEQTRSQFIAALKVEFEGLKVVTTKQLCSVRVTADNRFVVQTVFDPGVSNQYKESLTCYSNDVKGMCWLGAYDKIYVREQSSEEFSPIKTIPGNTGSIWSVSNDREGNTWFAADKGLFKLANGEVKAINIPNTYFKFCNGTPINGQGLLFSNSENLFSYTPRLGLKKQLIAGKRAFVFTDERFFFIEKDQLWANIYPEKTFGNYLKSTVALNLRTSHPIIMEKIDLQDSIKILINTAVQLGPYEFIIVANRKLYQLNSKSCKEIKILSAEKRPINPVKLHLSNHNKLLIADEKLGLVAGTLDLNKSGLVLNIEHVYPKPLDAWFDDKMSLATDKAGHIWVGHRNNSGLYCYTLKEDGSFKNYRLFQTPAISSNSIHCITVDSIHGNVWLGTSRGLDVIEVYSNDSFSIKPNTYGTETGSKNIFFLTQSGSVMYGGSENMLFLFNLLYEDRNAPAPPIYIQQFLVNGDPLRQSDEEIIKLNWDQQNIVIHYAGLSYTDEKNVTYKYILEGADKKWSKPVKERSISYSNLQPGHYVFKVMACNAAGVWSTDAAFVSFSIARPWYNTIVFYIACCLVAGILIYVLYKYRLKKELQVLNVRQRISTDLHDEIGSALSSIRLLSVAARHQIHKDQDKTSAFTEKIEHTSAQMIQQLNDIIWAVKPGNDTLEQTINRLREFMNDVLAAKQISFHIQEPKNGSMILPAERRRDFYLACREIINNTAKYSGATHFNMQIEYKMGMLTASLSDNGKGFDETILKKGNGLSNIRMRMAKNNGVAELLKSSGGVTWKLQMPLK